MRFGGHQTFYIREGWLYKGMDLLINHPERFEDPLVFDHLGVGKNMAMSIVYWLEATGLAIKEQSKADSRAKILKPTDLGRLVHKNDPYFTREETWWILHINLVANRESAETWYWFFNELGTDRFIREQGFKRFQKYIENDLKGRKPTQKTAERDLSCLINTYAINLPNTITDPEEDIWCPFRDLELLVSYKSTGHHVIQRRRRSIPVYIVLYALETSLQLSPNYHLESYENDNILDIRFFDLVRLPNNPQRVFALHNDGFFELLNNISESVLNTGLTIMGLAGERQIRILRKPKFQFAESMYNAKEVKNG